MEADLNLHRCLSAADRYHLKLEAVGTRAECEELYRIVDAYLATVAEKQAAEKPAAPPDLKKMRPLTRTKQ